MSINPARLPEFAPGEFNSNAAEVLELWDEKHTPGAYLAVMKGVYVAHRLATGKSQPPSPRDDLADMLPAEIRESYGKLRHAALQAAPDVMMGAALISSMMLAVGKLSEGGSIAEAMAAASPFAPDDAPDFDPVNAAEAILRHRDAPPDRM